MNRQLAVLENLWWSFLQLGGIITAMAESKYRPRPLWQCLIESTAMVEFIWLGSDFFLHRWSGIGRESFYALIAGLIFGTGRYFLDRRIAEEESQPNVL
ncbi:MAG TPA: hypothetical protein VFF39_05875 [Verrucomicrobiae bacterium]|nr:hypothetical protein [Verrucomicrobiae bacterium]